MKNRNKNLKQLLTKEFLYREYVINKKTIYLIAKDIGCDGSTILNYLNKHNIKIRTHSESMKGKNAGKNNYMYGKHHTKMTKEKIRNSNYHKNIKSKNNPNYIDNRINCQYYCKEEGCDNKISYCTWWSGNKRCNSCASKKKWQNKEFREKTLKSLFKVWNLSLNKTEQPLAKLLPNKYKFVGDGKLIVGGFCPDFVNKDNNKIIELFGDYWHNKTVAKKRDKGRLHAYKRNGYKTLIIWEHELKDIDKVTKKIIKFSK